MLNNCQKVWLRGTLILFWSLFALLSSSANFNDLLMIWQAVSHPLPFHSLTMVSFVQFTIQNYHTPSVVIQVLYTIIALVQLGMGLALLAAFVKYLMDRNSGCAVCLANMGFVTGIILWAFIILCDIAFMAGPVELMSVLTLILLFVSVAAFNGMCCCHTSKAEGCCAAKDVK